MLPLHYSINLTGFFSNAEALTSATLSGSDSFLWHDNVVVVLMPAACDSHGAALSHLLHTSPELCLQGSRVPNRCCLQARGLLTTCLTTLLTLARSTLPPTEFLCHSSEDEAFVD